MIIEPIIFASGEEFFRNLGEKYMTHHKGLFILAPSGAGKTHFCTNQTERNWIDGDDLWIKSGAHPGGPWWNESLDVINRVDQRSDVVTMEAKHQGFWIMGASNLWLKPDAIVIPKWEQHVKYIAHRENNGYDGGATSNDYDQVKGHIEVIKKWNTDHGVPLYESIDEAVLAITENI